MAFPARSLRIPCLLVLLVAGPTSARAPEPTEDAPPPQAPVVKERLTVHATRVPDRPEPVETVPAHVTVLTREDLARSGARTLQDALALEAGVVVYDQVGNDLEKTLDLRGFASGAGTAMFVDGVRINDPRNNFVALEAVPLAAVERIEITRGSAAGLVGGGSQAGVVHVLTRQGGEPGGSLSAAGGTHGGRQASAHVQTHLGGLALFASAEHDGTDGFRRSNGGGDLDRFAARAGLSPGEGHRLDLTASHTRLDAGAPGALRGDEYADDPWQNRFNVLDRNQSRARQAGLAYRGERVAGLALAVDLYVRDGQADSLTTGRSGFDFSLDAATRVLGTTLQAVRSWERSSLTAGAEWSEGRVDARGWFSAERDATPDADNRTDRRTLALFLRQTVTPRPAWTLHAGLRGDRDETAYRDALGGAEGSRAFSQVTGRGGVAWNPTPRNGAWASYAESFLPPTAEDLFAFPGFGSNELLEPERSRAWEVGWRHRHGERLEVTAAAFRIDTRDEIVFDPDDFRNVNAGETRRDGLEASVRGTATARVSWFARATVLEATFRNGPEAGGTVPLVPDARLAAGMDLSLGPVRLHAQALHVAEQVLDNDAANAEPRLAAYTVVDARAVWQAHPRAALFVEARNLLDERYATRGIAAFDSVLARTATFVTPAPGRRWLAGASWTF